MVGVTASRRFARLRGDDPGLGSGKLPGFLFGSTNGHLLVISGFDANGDVISNDPAVLTNDEVQKTYARADFESVWLEGSGGIVYVIRPFSVTLPPNVPGLPNNW